MHLLLICVFWGAICLTLYTYVGYPIWVCLRSRLWSRPWQQAQVLPTVSVILAVHNGSILLRRKIKQLLALDYPRDRIEFIVVSDGSTDSTNRILRDTQFIRAVICAERCGKAAALNLGMQSATGEILLFLDVRPRLESTSLRRLLSNFADPKVGCVAGEVVLIDDGHDPATKALGGLYWRYEKWIRHCESKVDSLLGVYGGFYAVRRELASMLPEDTVLDDMLMPLSVVRQGYRSVLDVRAVVYDLWPRSFRDEFRRKVRTLAGNFQLLQLAPWLLSRDNRVRFEFVSHKLFRLLVPLLLFALLGSSAMLAVHSRLYGALLITQLLLYMVAALGTGCGLPILVRMSGVARAFCLMNIAVVVGFYKFLFTRGPLWKIWIPTAALYVGKPDENIEAPLRGMGISFSAESISGDQSDGSAG
jgi:biofilm PGA synthesis N-glycosyltransferase PgaC